MWRGMPGIVPIQYWTGNAVPPTYGKPPVAWRMMSREPDWEMGERLPDFRMPTRLPEWVQSDRNET